VGEATGLDVAVDRHDASGGRSQSLGLGDAVGQSRRHWNLEGVFVGVGWIEGGEEGDEIETREGRKCT
jgi:hypothetical protein